MRVVLIGAILLFALVLAAHAALISIASWRPDEFQNFAFLRDQGWSYFFYRLLHWSPRPFSEALIGLYFLAVEWLRRPLTVPFLGLLWATLLIGPAAFVRRSRAARERWDRVALVLAVLCLCLLGHSLAEMFYWPLGAAAYLPVLAASIVITLDALDGRWDRSGPRRAGILALFLAAGSAEVGAILAILVGGCMLIALANDRRRLSRTEWALWLLLIAAGCGVMLALALGRGQMVESMPVPGVTADPRLRSHMLASLLRSVPTTLRSLLVLDGDQRSTGAQVWGAAVKLTVLLGFAAVLRPWPRRGGGRAMVALLAGLLLAIYVSIAGSYYKFGLVCCERHDTLRQCWEVLALLLLAGLLARPLGWLLRKLPAALARGPALLALAVLALMVSRLPALRHDAGLGEAVIASHRQMWRTGMAPGPAMVVPTTPLPVLVGGWIAPADGRLRRGHDPGWFWLLMLDYFHKDEIVLQPPRP